MLKATLPEIKRFKGLNNVSDPVRLGLGWLVQADNVDVTDTGQLVKRTGYSQAMTGNLSSAFSTRDFERAFLVDGNSLKAMTGPSSSIALKSGLATAPMYWAEINDQVYFNNETDAGIIQPDNTLKDWRWPVPSAPALAPVTGNLPAGLYRVCCTYILPDGRETGNSDPVELTLADGQALQIGAVPLVLGLTTAVYIAPADSTVFQLAWTSKTATAYVWNSLPDDLGPELRTDGMDPLPLGADVVQFWKGKAYAAQHFPKDNQTAIWFSQPLGFHLFNLRTDFFIVSGKVSMLAPTDSALIVGTDDRIYAYGAEGMGVLADYGVVPGAHWAIDDDKTLIFWSVRGLCRALPFSNLTEQQVSVAPGIRAGGCIIRSGGQKRFVACLQQGGEAFNDR